MNFLVWRSASENSSINLKPHIILGLIRKPSEDTVVDFHLKISRTMSKLSFLTLLLFFTSLFVLSSGMKNRSSQFNCYRCKGFDKELSKCSFTTLCVKPRENCYTLVQSDGARTIYTRGCGHSRVCKMAKRVDLYDLRYCSQCDTEKCNKETKFTYSELDVSHATSTTYGVTWTGALIIGLWVGIRFMLWVVGDMENEYLSKI